MNGDIGMILASENFVHMTREDDTTIGEVMMHNLYRIIGDNAGNDGARPLRRRSEKEWLERRQNRQDHDLGIVHAIIPHRMPRYGHLRSLVAQTEKSSHNLSSQQEEISHDQSKWLCDEYFSRTHIIDSMGLASYLAHSGVDRISIIDTVGLREQEMDLVDGIFCHVLRLQVCDDNGRVPEGDLEGGRERMNVRDSARSENEVDGKAVLILEEVLRGMDCWHYFHLLEEKKKYNMIDFLFLHKKGLLSCDHNRKKIHPKDGRRFVQDFGCVLSSSSSHDINYESWKRGIPYYRQKNVHKINLGDLIEWRTNHGNMVLAMVLIVSVRYIVKFFRRWRIRVVKYGRSL